MSVYFIQAGCGGPIKIGYADNIAARLSGLQSMNAAELSILGTILGGKLEEAQLHARFSDLLIRGEWFHPAASLLRFIEDSCAVKTAPPLPQYVNEEKSTTAGAKRVFAKFGGRHKLCDALSEYTGKRVPYTTVQSWGARSGGIPHQRWQSIINAGARKGVCVTAEDFLAP